MLSVTASQIAPSPIRERLLLGAAVMVVMAPVWSTAAYSISLGLMVLAWFAATPWRRPGWRPPFLVGTAVFAACLGAATAAAPDLAASWEEYRSFYPFLLLFLGADAVRDSRSHRLVVSAFLLSAGIAAAGATLSGWGLFGGPESRFSGAVGIFEYAFCMVLGWVCAAWFFLRAKQRFAALGWFVLTLLFLDAIRLNATRASLVALSAAAVLIAVICWRDWRRLLILLLPFLVAAAASLDSELGARLLKSDNEFRLEDPQSQRQVIWAHAWMLFREHPVLGAGPGSFTSASAALKGDPRLKGYPRLRHPYRTAHSIPLHLLATAGVIGLLGFLVWAADTVKRFLRGLSFAPHAAVPALATLTVVLAFGMTDMSLLNTRISGLLCLLLGIAAGAMRGAAAEVTDRAAHSIAAEALARSEPAPSSQSMFSQPTRVN